jgi:ankyrin repeat protein
MEGMPPEYCKPWYKDQGWREPIIRQRLPELILEYPGCYREAIRWNGSLPRSFEEDQTYLAMWLINSPNVDIMRYKEGQDAPIHEVIRKGNQILFDELVRHYVDLHRIGDCGQSTLHCAVDSNSIEIVKILLKSGVDP